MDGFKVSVKAGVLIAKVLDRIFGPILSALGCAIGMVLGRTFRTVRDSLTGRGTSVK